MLPLWIIDLRTDQSSNRRAAFEQLLGEIDHVEPYFKQLDESSESRLQPDAQLTEDIMLLQNTNMFEVQHKELDNEDLRIGKSVESSSQGNESILDEDVRREKLDAKEKAKGERESKVVGNYWRYSNIADMPIPRWKEDENQDNDGTDADVFPQKKWKDLNFVTAIECGDDNEDLGNRKIGIVELLAQKEREEKGRKENEERERAMAKVLYQFQSALVKEGQEFISALRSSNAKPHLKINVVVLGDVTEGLTRIVFPAIAGILQKEKGRMVPNHIHQGMEIVGMIYVPSDINTKDVHTRKSVQRTLKEIDVQRRISAIRGYDHVMIYQDVQNRTDCAYPKLDDKGIAAYLMQCVVHLYLACNETHPLLSGTASADVFYFSMGATSAYYNSHNEDVANVNALSRQFMKTLKTEGDNEKQSTLPNLIIEGEYEPEVFFKDTNLIQRLDTDDGIKEPKPHPIRNFADKYLKRYYYNSYLRLFTRNMMRDIISSIDKATRKTLDDIAKGNRRRYTDEQKIIYERLKEAIGQLSANDGGLSAIIKLFKDLQEHLSITRKTIRETLEEKYWYKIETEYLEKNLKDTFLEYHSAYERDIEEKRGGANQDQMKKQAVNELNGLLSNESTLMSRVSRSVFLGIMGALAILPILNMISPYLIDLGNIRRNALPWALGLFLIPGLIQIISYYSYLRHKKRAVNNLRAMFMHDAYARIANRVESEINLFYDKMTALADAYIKRCELIRKELESGYKDEEEQKPVFPETMFNQPLVGGKYGDNNLLPDKEVEDCDVRINHIRYKMSQLRKTEYFLLINQEKNLVSELFKDVWVTENLLRRIKENGEEELVTKENQEKELQSKWREHLATFYKLLNKSTHEAIQPRDNATIGEKLRNYCASGEDNANVLNGMIAYAASNGEATTSADLEFTDIKLNDDGVESYIDRFVTPACRQTQADKYNPLYEKYLFISRWRCFEYLNLNRLFPMEDFDEDYGNKMVAEKEKKAKEERARKEQELRNGQCREDEKENTTRESEEKEPYSIRISSLLLWALCPDNDDSSTEWFRLFRTTSYSDAYKGKRIFREELNQDD